MGDFIEVHLDIIYKNIDSAYQIKFKIKYICIYKQSLVLTRDS